jgi:hypothetical protein
MKKILLPLVIMTAVFASGCFEIVEDVKKDQIAEILMDNAKYALFTYNDGTYWPYFYNYATAGPAALAGYHIFGIGLSTATDPVVCNLWVKDGAIPGDYTQLDKDTVFKIEYDNDAAATPYVLDAAQSFTFTLKANGPGRMRGTFSGILIHSVAGPPDVTLTDGIFDIPYRNY